MIVRLCVVGVLYLLCAACGRTSEAESKTADSALAFVADRADVNGAAMEILTTSDACLLRAGGASIPLQPKPPCFFLRRSGMVQKFAYSDMKTDFVVIIAGTELNDAKRKTWNLKEGEQCGEAAQAVLRKNGEVRPSKSIHSDGIYCKERGVDEKEFWSFAHDPE